MHKNEQNLTTVINKSSIMTLKINAKTHDDDDDDDDDDGGDDDDEDVCVVNKQLQLEFQFRLPIVFTINYFFCSRYWKKP